MAAGAGPSRDQAFTLLAAANNHGDLNVKLSSLKQVKDILLSSPHRSSLSPELFPFLVELQSSPEPLVRKTLIEVVEDTGFKSMEHLYMLMPVLVASLEDIDSNVVCQSILSGIHLFCGVLEEMTLQFQRHGRVESWADELWAWMLKFKDAVFSISFEPSSIKAKLLALKFMEICVLLFTHDTDANGNSSTEGKHTFNISWLDNGHPILEQHGLNIEAKRAVGILLNLLRPTTRPPGPVMISVVSCMLNDSFSWRE